MAFTARTEATQLCLDLGFRTWGGARPGAGRKPHPKARAAHRSRPNHARRHPVHVTLRIGRQLGSMRRQQAFAVFWRAFRFAKDRFGMRIVHYSVQHDHVHLLVEADDARALSRGVRGFSIRVAKVLNGLLERRGRVFADRYHARDLKTPREVRNALVYVIHNFRKHATSEAQGSARFDLFSSAPCFPHWREGPVSWPRPLVGPSPVALPRTWLLVKGWSHYGAPSVMERPCAR